jgi:hypothetical protein
VKPQASISSDVSTDSGKREQVCPLLKRQGCVRPGFYGGVFDHFVDLECSALFEIRRELPLFGTPRRLARGVVLLEKSTRKKGIPAELRTFDYTKPASQEEKLVLKPAPVEILDVFYDDETPVILGRKGCAGAVCRDFSLWRIHCEGSCLEIGHFQFQSANELDEVPDLLPAMRADLRHTVKVLERKEKMALCMRSSAGCHFELEEGRMSSLTALGGNTARDSEAEEAQESSPTTPALGTLPNKKESRIELLTADDGLFLRRFEKEQETDKRLLFSSERKQPLGPVGLSKPMPAASGYVALLQTSSPAVFGALVRLSADGTMVGAPVLTATFAKDEWFLGCTDSFCLIAVHNSSISDAPIGRVIRLTDIAPPPCESQESVNIRY